jgi:hypothetical protein
VRDTLGAEAGDVGCRAVAALPGRAIVEPRKDANAQLVVLASRADAARAPVPGAIGLF